LHDRAVAQDLGSEGFALQVKQGSLSSQRAAQLVDRELTCLHELVHDFQLPENLGRIRAMRRRSAATRIGLAWRRKLLRSLVVPPSVTPYMRRGYVFKRETIRSRKNHLPLNWLAACISGAYASYLESILPCEQDQRLASPKAAFPSIQACVGTYFLSLTGNRCVADRLLHDFFFNVKNMRMLYPRARLFAGFVGMPDVEDMEVPNIEAGLRSEDDYLRSSAALAFYLRAACSLSQAVHDDAASSKVAQETACLRLFPVTHRDEQTGQDIWRMKFDRVSEVLQALFSSCCGAESDQSKSIVFALKKLQDDEDCVDVDEALWHVMKLWKGLAAAPAKSAEADVNGRSASTTLVSLSAPFAGLACPARTQVERVRTQQYISATSRVELSPMGALGSQACQAAPLDSFPAAVVPCDATTAFRAVRKAAELSLMASCSLKSVKHVEADPVGWVTLAEALWASYHAPIESFIAEIQTQGEAGDEHSQAAQKLVGESRELVEGATAVRLALQPGMPMADGDRRTVQQCLERVKTLIETLGATVATVHNAEDPEFIRDGWASGRKPAVYAKPRY